MSDSTAGGHPIPSGFSQLVMMLATSALQQLGQFPGPDGKPSEVHLPAAQSLIDTLDMLREKTKGNLDDAEQKMLNESLTMLRLQFVEIAQAHKTNTGSASTPAAAVPNKNEKKEETPSAEPPPSGNTGTSENKTRYRKSYG